MLLSLVSFGNFRQTWIFESSWVWIFTRNNHITKCGKSFPTLLEMWIGLQNFGLLWIARHVKCDLILPFIYLHLFFIFFKLHTQFPVLVSKWPKKGPKQIMGHPRWSTLNNVLWCASRHGETFGRDLSLCCYCRRHLCLWLSVFVLSFVCFLQRLWYFLSSDFAGNEYNPVLLLLRKLFQVLLAAAPTLSTPRFNFISQIFGS